MLSINPIPAFNDNYIWCIQMTGNAAVFVVDPGDADAVEHHLSEQNLQLAGILITHHHQDHTGGITSLTKDRTIPVYGPDNPHIAQVTHPLSDGDSFELLGTRFQVIATPGHTLDHIAYFSDASSPVLFSGDTLFAGGCGRLFEGSAAMMHHSLNKLSILPEDTNIYCAHEYTLSNLAFCAAVEPDNTMLAKRILTDQQLRQQQQPTIPSTLGMELKTNPFLRCDQPSVIAAAEQHSAQKLTDSASVLRVIRAWKDNF